MKKLLLLLTLFFNFLFLGAQKLAIDGKIVNFEKKPVENATVYLLREKDSSIINYTSTNREGRFSLKTDEINEPSILKADADKLISYSKRMDKINGSLSLGDIELDKNSVTHIEEIKLTASPVKIKKDTIEFNASSIKVRPDSKIEELLKQIPGVEISNEGKITVNGKEADQILVNGKPFFDKDGKVALQNLPADIIKSIQFTTTKTKEEELNGKAATSNNATINFNIDEKKNKGLLSRLTLGYGSDKRYETSGLLSYFKNDTKISLLASSNNINSQGFSNDEIFDSMGRGRNSWLMQGSRVVRSGSSTYYVQSANQKGIQRSTTIGLNYSDQFGKQTDLENLSLIHLDNNLKTRSKVSRTTFLTDDVLKTNSENEGENESRQYNVDLAARVKLDSLTSVYFSPSFSRTEGFDDNRSSSATFRNNLLANESNAYTHTDSESNTFSPNIYFSKQFSKKGRRMSVNMNSEIGDAKNNTLTLSRNIFYQGSNTSDNRDQIIRNKNQNDSYRFSADYTEPVSDSLYISFGMNYEAAATRNEREVNDYDDNTGRYTRYNSVLSNRMNQRINKISPQLSFELNKKKINAWGSFNAEITDMAVRSAFTGQEYGLQKNFVLPTYNTGLRYQFSESSSMSLYNFSDVAIPTAEQLSPYLDVSNPLVTYQGNPELKNAWNNMTYLYLNNFNRVKNTSYYINAGFTYKANDIINASYFDESGRQRITYVNANGNKSLNLGGSFSKTFKWKEVHKLTVSPKFNMYYNFTRGLIDGQEFASNSYNLNPGLNFTYELKDKIIIKPSYSVSYNFSNYQNYNVDRIRNSYQTLRLEMTNYLFRSRLVLGNDFEYNTNSNIAAGFKKDFYFWNTSVGYSFFNKQLTAKVKVYDVLNQNQSVRRTITNTYFEDRDDLILKRYVMFSLTMKLNKFAGKKTQN